MDCSYCKKTFSSKSNLGLHQKTAKYCIEIQTKDNNTTIDHELSECKYCNNKFSKHNYSRHVFICKDRMKSLFRDLQIENIKKDTIITQLRSELELCKKIDTRSSVKTVKIVSNMIPLDLRKELFPDIINEYYTLNHMFDGQKGVAKFALDFILRDKNSNLMYICTDVSRGNFMYKDLSGKLVHDQKCTKIIACIYDAIIEKSITLTKDYNELHKNNHKVSMPILANIKNMNFKASGFIHYMSRMTFDIVQNEVTTKKGVTQEGITQEGITQEEDNEKIHLRTLVKELQVVIAKITQECIDLRVQLDTHSSHNFEEEAVIEMDIDTVPEDIPYELVSLDVGNDYKIESREADGYVNVTNLCKAGGKQFNGWNRLDKTKAFLEVLSMQTQIHVCKLISIEQISKTNKTTWVHPQVAINIAQWISPQFDVKVSIYVGL